MKKILDVPFVSQYEISRDQDGLGRACGIACVQMIIGYIGQEKISMKELSDEAKMIQGGYLDGIGWTDMGITALLRNHNISCYSEEFRSVFNDIENKKVLPSPYETGHIERGILKIVQEIENNKPIIISGIKNWNEKSKPHKMVVVGFEKEGNMITGFYYHDSHDESKDGKNNFIDIGNFRTYWRKFAIFLDLE